MEITSKSNVGNPLRNGLINILNCDISEHANYIDDQNKRLDYLNAFWKVIEWEVIEKRI